jgi:AhpD family alkylhydroperoxidase
MSPIARLRDDQAQGPVAAAFAAIKGKFGAVPDMFRAMANSPVALDGYFAFSGALAKGSLDARTAESIALASAKRHGCDFCSAAHGQLAKGAGMSAAEIALAREAKSLDAKTQAALDLARAFWDSAGRDAQGAVHEAKRAGLSDGDIAEIAAHVAINVYTNFFNNLALIEPPASWKAAA